MLGQYGLGAGSAYGQRRAPLGFGGSGSPQVSYGAYTPPQSLGQSPQTKYSSYTPPGGMTGQPMGVSSYAGLGGATQGQTLGNGQYYHLTNENYTAPNSVASGGGPVSRADASRLSNSSNSFGVLERLPGLGATNVPGYGYNMMTGLLESSPWSAQTQQAPQQDNGLGGMTWDSASNSWGYAGLNNPDSLRGSDGGTLSYGPSASLTPRSIYGRANGGLPTGINWMANNPYGAMNNPTYIPGASP